MKIFLIIIILLTTNFYQITSNSNMSKTNDVALNNAKENFIKHLKEQKVLLNFRNYYVQQIHQNINIKPFFMLELKTEPILQPQKVYTAIIGNNIVLKGSNGFSILMKAINFSKNKQLNALELMLIDETIESVRIPIIWDPKNYNKINSLIKQPELKFLSDNSAKLVYWYTPLSIGTPLKRIISISANGDVSFNQEHR